MSEGVAHRRELLGRLADELIAEGPGASGCVMPAASAVGVHKDLMDRVLSAAPAMAETLETLLAEADGQDPAHFVRCLAADRPEEFAVLSTAVMGAYYLSEEVRLLIGYPGQEPSPLSVAAEPEYLDLLERVYERHHGYREAP